MQQKLPGCKYRVPTVVSPFETFPAIALSLDLPAGYWTLQPVQDREGIIWDKKSGLSEEKKKLAEAFTRQIGQMQSGGMVISWQDAKGCLASISGHPPGEAHLAGLITALNDWFKHPLSNAELLSWLDEATGADTDAGIASLIYGGMIQRAFGQVQRIFLPNGTNWLLENNSRDIVSKIDISAADLIAILLALHSGNHDLLIESRKHYSPVSSPGVLMSTSPAELQGILLHLLSISDPSPEWLSGQLVWCGSTGMDGVRPV